MKKLSLLTFILAVFAIATQAQDGKFRFGVYMAPGTSWMKPFENNVKKDGSKGAFGYGIAADYQFHDRYAFTFGLQVNHEGGKVIITDSTEISTAGVTYKLLTDKKIQYKMQYLEIPLAIKLRTKDYNNLRIFGQVGGAIGVPISSKWDYQVSGPGYTASVSKTKNLNEIIPVNLSMQLGVGAEYEIADKTNLYGGLFFTNGFTDVTKNKGDSKLNDGKISLSNLGLRIGVFF
jgi:hypothetical protein